MSTKNAEFLRGFRCSLFLTTYSAIVTAASLPVMNYAIFVLSVTMWTMAGRCWWMDWKIYLLLRQLEQIEKEVEARGLDLKTFSC